MDQATAWAERVNIGAARGSEIIALAHPTGILVNKL
jgi:hypothetical protein